MAERRMFSKTITGGDAFLDMPLTTQALYFHLAMLADDEGFINSPKKIQRMIGASDDDMRVLISEQFIIKFESGIVAVKHWRIHNYIPKDRFRPTMFTDEKSQLITDGNGAYEISTSPCIQDVYKTDTNCIQSVYEMDTQDRLGKVRIGEDSIGKVRLDKDSIDYKKIVDMYNDTCVSFPPLSKLSDSRRKSIDAIFSTGYTYDDFKELFEKTENSKFLKGSNDRNWVANFDWLIKDDNMVKVLDGNYDEYDNKSSTSDTNDSYLNFINI
jgi:hypothetical protein